MDTTKSEVFEDGKKFEEYFTVKFDNVLSEEDLCATCKGIARLNAEFEKQKRRRDIARILICSALGSALYMLVSKNRKPK